MFETCVDQLVKVELTNQTVKTEWFCGTLFINNITTNQANQVATMLRTKDLGKIDMNRIGDTNEFAFDFI
jgi:hypothetical protein